MKKQRALDIARKLQRMYPKATVALDYTTQFELLIATILSAQSTDARVNLVTKNLFKKYRGPKAIAGADPYELEQDIHSTGFYKNKTKSIMGASKAIVENHGGEVPSTMEELVKLPGVGRKTANVVLSNAFKTPVGVVVDTHVSRVAGRLGLTASSDPEGIEQELMRLLPQKEWTGFANRLIFHGRNICIARKPKCRECLLNELCPSAEEPLE